MLPLTEVYGMAAPLRSTPGSAAMTRSYRSRSSVGTGCAFWPTEADPGGGSAARDPELFGVEAAAAVRAVAHRSQIEEDERNDGDRDRDQVTHVTAPRMGRGDGSSLIRPPPYF